MSTPVSRLGMRVPLGTGVGLAEPISGPNIGADPVAVHSVGGFGGGIRSVGGVFRDPAASDVMPLLHEVRNGNIERLIDCAEKAGNGDVKARSILQSFVKRFSQLYYNDFEVLDAFNSACDPHERSSALVKGVRERIDIEGLDALADYAARSENANLYAYELIEYMYDDIEDADEPDDDLTVWLEKNAPLTLVNLRAVKSKDARVANGVPGFEEWVERRNAAFDTDRCISLDARFDDAMFTLFGEFVDVAKRNHMAYRVLGFLTTKSIFPWAVMCELNERGRLTPRAEMRAKRIVDACIASGDYRRMVNLCPMVLYGDPSASRVMAYFCEQSFATHGALNKLNAWLGRADSLFLRRDVDLAVIESQHVHDAICALGKGAYRLMEALAVMGDECSRTHIKWMSSQGAYPKGVESLAHFREVARSRELPALSDAAMCKVHDSVAAWAEEDERIQELTPWILQNLADDRAWLDSADARVILGDSYDVYLERLSSVALSMSEYEDEELIRRAVENFASTVRDDISELPAFVTLVLDLPESDWLKALYGRFDSEALRAYMEQESSNAFWVSMLAKLGSVPALEAVKSFEKVDILEIHVLQEFAKAGNDAAKHALAEMEAETEDGEDAEVIPFQKPK